MSSPESFDPLARLPGYALRRAANAMMVELGNRLANEGMRISEASVVMLIAERPGLTSSEIGKILDIQRANMAPLLNRIEAGGLIRREPIDRKSYAIALTAEGEAKAETVRKVTGKFEADLLARIPAEHRDHFVPALNALW